MRFKKRDFYFQVSVFHCLLSAIMIPLKFVYILLCRILFVSSLLVNEEGDMLVCILGKDNGELEQHGGLLVNWE